MGCSKIGKIGLPSASGRFVKAQTLCGPVSGGIGRSECSKNCVSAPLYYSSEKTAHAILKEIPMSIPMDESIKRWTAKRKSALVVEII